jgi:hypothetical protein
VKARELEVSRMDETSAWWMASSRQLRRARACTIEPSGPMRDHRNVPGRGQDRPRSEESICLKSKKSSQSSE